METVDLATSQVFTRKDARKPDDANITGLMASIREIGILNPLRVRLMGSVEDSGLDSYEVIAGAHRLRAARKLGMETVPCVVVDDDDLRAELAMIDENLCRAELSPADRASQTARRKAIYLELHPETAQGVAGAAARWDATAKSATASFVTETAEAVGKAERTVRLDAERGEKISQRALSMVVDTALNTGRFLDTLKRIEGEDAQVDAVQKALVGVAKQAERDRAASIDQRNQSRIEADVKRRAARIFAEALAEKFGADEWDFVKAQLASATSKDILAEFLNLTGASVIDRGAA